jgi:sarcosine oxidase subunit beta
MRNPDVLIVGGGVIGCAIAYELARFGVTRVMVLERHRLASGATGVCPGGIRQQFEGEADCVLARESVRFFEQINDILEPDHPFVFERSGYLFLAESDAQLARYARNVQMQNRLGIPSRLIDIGEVRQIVSAIECRGIRGGAYCAEDGFIEDCHGVTHAFAARARRHGVEIAYDEVVSIEHAARTWCVATRHDRFEAPHVVLATGADTVTLAEGIGLGVPVRAECRRLVYTAAARPGLVEPLVVLPERGVAGKQLRSGVFYLGWLRETAETDDLTFAEEALRAGSTLLPMLHELPIRHVIAGVYDSTPDHRPILGGVRGLEGLQLAVGFSGHGFMIAPAVAEIVAAGVIERHTELPAAAFSLDRFSRTPIAEGLVI